MFCDQPGCFYCEAESIPCPPGRCGKCDDRFREIHRNEPPVAPSSEATA